MKKNVGGFDKYSRLVLGVVLMALAANGTVGVWGYVGIVPLVTGAMGFCPLYTLFGFNSCPLSKN